MPEIRSLQDDQFFRNNASFRIMVFIGVIFSGLILRLWFLQVQQYDYHLRLSEKNRVRLKILEAPRGLILDRNGHILARNRPSYQVSIMPIELKEKSSVVNNLMKVKNPDGSTVFDSTLVVQTIKTGQWRRFEALPILEDASMDIVSIVEEHQLDLPGVVTVVESRREYPGGSLAGHGLGYTAEISESEFESYKKKGYRLGNRVGVKGLEKKYEPFLRGKEGKKFLEVNVYGKEIGVIENMPNEPAESGMNLITTLDLGLQEVAETAFPDSLKGAVVAIDPRNGEIMVLMSSPRIDGNIFSFSKTRRNQEWNDLAFDSEKPLNNRATIGVYDPGSTFKALVSLAGFVDHVISTEYSGFKPCRGGYKYGNRTWKCWKPSGHGASNFYDAFRQSCDVYYYQAGLNIGIDRINEMATRFGLGKNTGVDLVSERSGLLVDSASYVKKFKSKGWRWSPGLVLNLSIGQGQLVTPLQLANYAAGLGNGEVIYRPHLMREIRTDDGITVERYEPEVISTLNIGEEAHTAILEALRQVVEDPGGTGHRAGVPGVTVGGKSGSAENPFGEMTHALFVAIAPLYAPEIAIAVILENAGHGGSVAAPIAGKILEYFFKGSVNGTRS